MIVGLLARASAAALALSIVACSSNHGRDESSHPVATPSIAPDASGDLAGSYTVFTWIGGVDRSEEVTLTPHAATYDAVWHRAGRQIAQGFAIEIGHMVAVVRTDVPTHFWNDYQDLGLAVYEVDGSEMQGTRVFKGDPLRRFETQTLRAIPDESRMYDVVDDDATGTTRVKVSPNGTEGFLVTWYDPNPSYIGVGVRLDNYIVVGFSKTTLPAVEIYCRLGDRLVGLGSAGKNDLYRPALEPFSGTYLPKTLVYQNCQKALRR